MISRSNAHTHTQYCDGRSTIDQIMERARQLDFVSIGFSGHGYQTFDHPYFMTEANTRAYLDTLRALQKDSRSPRVWVGVEQDYYSRITRADYDYVIGSAHYMRDRDGARFFSVDTDKDTVDAGVRDMFGGDGMLLARVYYRQLVDMVREIRPDIVGHFDIVRKNNGKNEYFDAQSKEYRFLALDALEAIAPMHPLIEVNTGGYARGFLPDFYPTEELLTRMRALDLDVIVTSDCHRVELLDTGMDMAEALLRKLGFDRVTRLSANPDRLFETVAL